MVQIFEIGIITKAQGIRGEVRVLPTTDDPTRFELLVGEEVFLKDAKITATKPIGREMLPIGAVSEANVSRSEIGFQKIAIISARLQKNIIVLKLDGIDSRNAAEELIGAIICVENAQALPLDEDEFYVRDLIGLRAETEEGEFLGEISRIFPTGANDVYVISGDTEFMVPAVKNFVKKILLDEGKIILRLADGMRELKTGGTM